MDELDKLINTLMTIKNNRRTKDISLSSIVKSFNYYKDKGATDELAEDLALKSLVENHSY